MCKVNEKTEKLTKKGKEALEAFMSSPLAKRLPNKYTILYCVWTKWNEWHIGIRTDNPSENTGLFTELHIFGSSDELRTKNTVVGNDYSIFTQP